MHIITTDTEKTIKKPVSLHTYILEFLSSCIPGSLSTTGKSPEKITNKPNFHISLTILNCFTNNSLTSF